MYKPENYTIQELAHPQIIKAIGEKNTWRRLSAAALRDLQKIRNKWYQKYKSGIYCNRLDVGLDSRGLRPPNDPDGAFYSTHKQGGTFDLEPVNGMLRELFNFIYQMILNNELEHFNTLENFEDTLKWVHVGYMNTDKKPLIIYL
ncbi:hypothetical protein M1M24_gp35 [Polaribacter phage Freya_1]|uniref:Peptidase n=1 Tax=Polaribacter phage Freya_1 TaxID=2745662 RepID=A0A8E4ZD04_9CAUD|nr:hypothetical protein M1M24_gp35 [Polaribacter phage Freya_1]QQV90654.1 hypothetical protein Danklef3_22 [Polaribacter phage Danklef_3]QQV90808.1 hypothetical protein Danklef5_22 [Polaribacter phage Danklef_5]QQV90972.1 hypothetical protein Freya2_35 [Polaribacter phage Freya_2]QQV91040.1 hypothetical protein Freya3_35 [Polaribacter phage Freya_3]QQV91108.1 hypothetical protein Freya4_35 [Polaribacter phage Freya_4]QQV91183.1 hypothetical protein Freya8_42 [Polaribacter phage Freya_8]QQV91